MTAGGPGRETAARAPGFDAAVIGAGILGAATAYRLARAGRRVVVLDAGTPAGEATGNSFAWLNAVSKEPEAYHHLNAAGIEEYRALGDERGAARLHWTGCIEWTATPETADRLRTKVARLRDRGYAAEIIPSERLHALEPELRMDGVHVAAFYPRDGWVDAPAACRALLDRVRALGGDVRAGCRVQGFRAADGRVNGLETADGVLAAGLVVLCAGTGTRGLARQLGVAIPIERRPGLLAVTEPLPPGTLSRVIYAPGFHIRPDAGGARIGADDVDATASVEMADGARARAGEILRERAATMLPALKDVSVVRVHLGVRPVPADGHTVAGRLPGWENAWVAVTHSGITLGPLLGRLLAEEIVTGRRDPLLAPFGPERFAAP